MAMVNPSLFYNALATLTLVSICAEVVVASFAPAPAPSTFYSLATDTQALLRFKAALDDDPYGTLLAWNTTFHTCDWYGVTCREDRVISLNLTACRLLANVVTNNLISPLDRIETVLLSRNAFYGAQIGLVAGSLRKLDLSFNNLTGNIPPRLFTNCSNLEWLDLSSNSLSGNLPPSIGTSCKTLAHLNVSNNSLAGLIPPNTLAPNTASLDLSSNNFSGPLASFFNIGDCSNVTWLDLSANSLSGSIPPAIASCVQLRHLNVSVNQLDGPLPEEIGSMSDTLEDLDLSHNLQSGSIPLSWKACANLRFLNLVGNNLTGNFPAEAVTGMKSIEKLLLGFNYFTGNLPVSLVENPLLEVLDLSSNTFAGEIPVEICGARSLKRLWLQGNGLTGQIPSGIQNCSNLAVLDLSINFLTGGIPDALVSLPYLEDLVLWGNELAGPVPEGICRGGHLFRFIANLNLLTGEIPISLLNCTRLEWLALSGNQLTGRLPEELGLLVNIGLIELANNSFTGVVPASLGNCTKLFWLDLNSNWLEGTIPAELVRNSGKIPVGDLRGLSFAYLKNVGSTCKGLGGLLEFAGIRDNLLDRLPILQQCNFTRLYQGSDPYPFSANGSIRYLDLSYNQLVGEIPVEFGTMMWLSAMSLSNNNLTGEIPSTFGNLLRLAVLDLSHNQLLGRIPASLNNLGFLYQLDLSSNQLSGSIPSNGKLSTFPAKVFANNFGLCGEPLPPCGEPNYNSSIMGGADSVSESKSKWTALAIAAAVVVALISVVAVFICTRKTQQKLQETLREQYLDSLSMVKTWSISNANEPLSINVASFEKMLKKLKFAHLLEATNGFSDDAIIGSGGFGDVYKGVLKDGTAVAVKKLLHTSGQGDREFSAEMETIGKIKHRNLVPLLGYCTVGEERLLVYEYMEGGSLEKRLHSPLDGNPLNQEVSPLVWSDRKHIIYGAARGLCFLHHNCIPRIIHRDMKTSNVLLDITGEARLSDFGMARLVNTMDTHMSATTLAGTPGYIPPEYFQSFRCTTKGDVYSFGVVMLELLTGRRPTHKEAFGDSNLVGWVKQNVAMNTHLHTLDPTLVTLGEEGRRDGDEMSKCLGIALKCLEDRPPKRPSMLEVVAFLRRELLHNNDEESSSSSNNSTSF